jgi:hypothetical protein
MIRLTVPVIIVPLFSCFKVKRLIFIYTPHEMMLDLSVLFISTMVKCVFSSSLFYIESLNCDLLRNMGSLINSKCVL